MAEAPKYSQFTTIVEFLTVSRETNALNYKVLATSQPDYVHNFISVQFTCRTSSSSIVTFARPSASTWLQICLK